MKKLVKNVFKTIGIMLALMVTLHIMKNTGINILDSMGLDVIVGVAEDFFDALDCLDIIVLIQHLRRHHKKVNEKI